MSKIERTHAKHNETGLSSRTQASAPESFEALVARVGADGIYQLWSRWNTFLPQQEDLADRGLIPKEKLELDRRRYRTFVLSIREDPELGREIDQIRRRQKTPPPTERREMPTSPAFKPKGGRVVSNRSVLRASYIRDRISEYPDDALRRRMREVVGGELDAIFACQFMVKIMIEDQVTRVITLSRAIWS